MLRSSVKRGAMAMLLMCLMVAPFASCFAHAGKSQHSCCMRAMQESAPVMGANCCVVKPQLPALAVAPTLPGSSPAMAEAVSVVMQGEVVRRERNAANLSPPFTPPPGKFQLRI